jgi:hypothetical protein
MTDQTKNEFENLFKYLFTTFAESPSRALDYLRLFCAACCILAFCMAR